MNINTYKHTCGNTHNTDTETCINAHTEINNT